MIRASARKGALQAQENRADARREWAPTIAALLRTKPPSITSLWGESRYLHDKIAKAQAEQQWSQELRIDPDEVPVPEKPESEEKVPRPGDTGWIPSTKTLSRWRASPTDRQPVLGDCPCGAWFHWRTDRQHDPADLRADLARHQIHIYVVAPAVGLHPRRLGRMLSGAEPMRADVARSLERAITATLRDRTPR